MQFIHAALAFGALLFAVPLIIHLLNRQRFRRRDWAAMEFLLRAYKKNRRRLRTENLLLLLLRCLIPVVLAFALARPFFTGDGILPTASGTAHHVLVFDHSYSMGLEPTGSESPHSKATRMAQTLLKQLDGRTGQKVTLLSAGVRPRLMVREDLNLSRVRDRLARVEGPEDSAESLLPALTQVAEMLEDNRDRPEATVDASVRIYVFTDLQRGCFGKLAEANNNQDTAKPTDIMEDTAREVLARLQKLGSITILDVGAVPGGREDNLQLSDLRVEGGQALVKVPTTVTVKLRNLSQQTRIVPVTLEVDGAEPTRQTQRIEAGEEIELRFPKMFRERRDGLRQLRASIDGDGLAADNERHCVVPVRERIRVLLVEGSMEAEASLQDGFWLKSVLDPTDGKGPPEVTEFAPKVIDSLAFLSGQENPADYDLLILANVERLNERTATQVRDAVNAGAGLFVMLGDRCDLASYNLHLYAAGKGPMPMRLVDKDGYQPGGSRYLQSRIVQADHPVLSEFRAETFARDLEVTPVYRFVNADRESLTKQGVVLLQLSNPTRSPLLFAGRFGEGRTLFMTSAISKREDRWNRLENRITSFLLLFPTARWLSQPAADRHNVLVGMPLSANLRQKAQNLAVVLPERGGARKTPIGKESRPLPGKRFALPPFTQTHFGGVYIYEMEMADQQGRVQRLPFAVNPAAAEGQLEYMTANTVRDRLGVQRVLRALPRETSQSVEAGVSELGPMLLYLTLFFLLGEAALARFVSRRRR